MTSSLTCLHSESNNLLLSHFFIFTSTVGSEAGGEGAIPIPESAEGIIKVIEGLTHDKSGTYYTYKGEVLEW